MSGLSGYPRTSPAVKGDSGCLFALGPNSGRHTLAVPRDVGSLAARPRRSGNTMRRREFIAATAALLVSPRRSRAQGARRRLGVLAINEMLPTMQNAWLDGLRNHGWIDGRNLIIEYRYARSQDRLFKPVSVACGPIAIVLCDRGLPVSSCSGLMWIHRLSVISRFMTRK